MVNGNKRRKRRRRSQQGSGSSVNSETLSPESKRHSGENQFEVLSETTPDPVPDTSLSATAGLIAQANSVIMNTGTDVDQNLLAAIGNIVDEKLKNAVAEIKNDFAQKLTETVSKLEDRVKKVESENKRLREAVENLPLGEAGDPDSIREFIKDSVDTIMKEKGVLTRPAYDYSRTLLASGVTELPGEDPMKVAEQLLDKGLGKPNMKIVRARRIQMTRKPGHLKIELESEDAKKEALAETGRLVYYKAQGNKVIVRSSQRFEDRIQRGNWDTMRYALGLENQLRVNKHGKLLQNTQQQQQQQPRMQQQQFQMQQQPQMQQQQPQMQQQQYPFQPQGQQQQYQFGQQQPQQQIPQQQTTQQQFTQQQPNQVPLQYGQSQSHPQPPTSYANAARPRGNVQTKPFNIAPNSNAAPTTQVNTAVPNPGVLTNQFRFNFDPTNQAPPSTAPVY